MRFPAGTVEITGVIDRYHNEEFQYQQSDPRLNIGLLSVAPKFTLKSIDAFRIRKYYLAPKSFSATY